MILAIDMGTSSTRTVIYDLKGQVRAMAQRPLEQQFPFPGWVEQSPEEIWQKTVHCIQEVIDALPGSIETMKACAITNQRESIIAWHKESGAPLSPAILWLDRRTELLCEKFQDKQQLITNKTGLIVNPYFSATKCQWLFNNNPEVQEAMKAGKLCLSTIDSFLMWRLSKGRDFVTDVTNASRTMLYNINENNWDEELLELFAIPNQVLPKVKPSCGYFTEIDKAYFGKAIPITGVAGDQQAATIGQICFKPGMIKATFGTGGFLLMNTGSKKVTSSHQLLSTICYQVGNKLTYGLEGSIFTAGNAVRWLRDSLGIIKQSSDTEMLASKLASNGGVYLVPAFTGLGAPFWHSNVKASFLGMQLGTTKAELVRATLESICYQTKALLAPFQKDSGHAVKLLRVDGGMVVNNWFLQYLADSCEVVVERPKTAETSAWGIAMLAALGAGLFSSIADIESHYQIERIFSPHDNLNKVKTEYTNWLEAVRISSRFVPEMAE